VSELTTSERFTVDEAAERLGLTTMTIYNYIKRGIFKNVVGYGKRGDPYLIPISEIDLLIEYQSHPMYLRMNSNHLEQ